MDSTEVSKFSASNSSYMAQEVFVFVATVQRILYVSSALCLLQHQNAVSLKPAPM
jgi:hypothetical protein